MKMSGKILRKIINEEIQLLSEAKYNPTHDDVKTLQSAINFIVDVDNDEDIDLDNLEKDLKDALNVDGIFGRNTDRELRKAQSQLGVKPDGLAGPKTMIKMSEAINEFILEIENEAAGDFAEEEFGPIADDLKRLIDLRAVMGMSRGKPKKKKSKPEPEEKEMSVGGKDSEAESSVNARGYDISKGPIKRNSKQSHVDYLNKEGIKKAVLDGINYLFLNNKIKNKDMAMHVLSTLPKKSKKEGRISELHATLLDVAEARGIKLINHYNRLLKGYKGILQRTNKDNRDNMKAKLEKRIGAGAKEFKKALS